MGHLLFGGRSVGRLLLGEVVGQWVTCYLVGGLSGSPYQAACPLPSLLHAIHATNSSPFHAIQPIPPETLSIAP